MDQLSLPGSSTDYSEIVNIVLSSLSHEWSGIREDLKLHKGAPDERSLSTWIVEDPVQGTFFQLGKAEVDLFICLAKNSELGAALTLYFQQLLKEPEAGEISSFLTTLQNAGLTRTKIPGTSTPTKSWLKWLGSYLFFRIPILRPDSFLSRIEPFIRFLWSPIFVGIYVFLSAIGVVLVSQQIELYLSTVNYLLTPSGMFLFTVALAVVKIAHEMAHGLASKTHGLYVRRMGVAFMVFVPMLYTDTTDAWKLPTKKSRLLIDGAGIMTEMVIAGLALFGWTLVSDGPWKSLLFALSSATVISTLLGNLNPMMRFDGYYLLMDWWGVSNLHSRATMMLRYKIRRWILNWQGPSPERPHLQRRLWLFGLLCLVYRLFLYFGIALIVYHFVFKALGVLLVVFQIVLMIVLPTFREIRFWFSSQRYWGPGIRPWIALFISIVFICSLNVPFSWKTTFPALFLLEDVVKVEVPDYGRLVRELPKQGEVVQQGQVVVELQNELLEQERVRLSLERQQLRKTIENTPSGGNDGGYRKWLQAEESRLTAEYHKLDETINRLKVVSKIDGSVVSLNDALRVNSVISTQTPILTIADPSKWEVRAYIPVLSIEKIIETNLEEVLVRFDDLETKPFKVVPRSYALFPAIDYPNYALFDIANGPIATQDVGRQSQVPLQAQYTISFSVPNGAALRKAHGTPCSVELSGKKRSVIKCVIDWIMPILAAEGLV